MTHGVIRSYWAGCRCDECRAANVQYTADRRKARKAALGTKKIKHGGDAYDNWGCRCEVCRAGHNARHAPHRQRYIDADPEREAKRQNEKNKRANAQAQRRTRQAAQRHGYEWTGPELEMAARRDMTVEQIALAIGRTKNAVGHMRRLLKEDPRVINLAGLPEVPRDRD